MEARKSLPAQRLDDQTLHKMKYARPPFPQALYSRFRKLAATLGWAVRGQCWKFLEMLLDYAELHPNLFRMR